MLKTVLCETTRLPRNIADTKNLVAIHKLFLGRPSIHVSDIRHLIASGATSEIVREALSKYMNEYKPSIKDLFYFARRRGDPKIIAEIQSALIALLIKSEKIHANELRLLANKAVAFDVALCAFNLLVTEKEEHLSEVSYIAHASVYEEIRKKAAKVISEHYAPRKSS